MAKKKSVKKTRTIKNSSEEPFFIGLNDPTELRKHLLEPTREVIQFLQSYEEFQRIKEEKNQAILTLKEDLKMISSEINKLRRFLPKGKLKIAKPSVNLKEETKPVLVKKVKPKAPNDLDRLEKELGEIEDKLGTITE